VHQVRIGPWLNALSMVVMMLAAIAPPIRAASAKTVSIHAADGRTITALLFEADQRPAPAVVLVPMLGRSKDDWQAIGQKLSDANITAVAMDLRSPALPADPKEIASWPDDVRAAIAFLASRPETRAGALGVAGASLGATIGAQAAASDPRIRSLALISPSLDYRGVHIESAMRQYGTRPALLLASVHDPYAARSARELAKDAPGPRELQWSETTAHGMLLLTQDADLVRAFVEWFQRTLG
jgi:dienelactone hydrolase